MTDKTKVVENIKNLFQALNTISDKSKENTADTSQIFEKIKGYIDSFYKDELSQLRERFNSIKEENDELKQKLKYHDEDASLITMKYERTNKEKHSHLIELEAQIKEDHKDGENKLDSLKQAWSEKILEIEKDYEEQITGLKSEIESLNESIRTITHYKDNYAQYEQDLKVLADENERLAKEIDFKTKDLEEKHLEETNKTKRAAASAIKDVRVKALTEAFKRLETMDLMKYQENDRLAKDLKDMSEEIKKIKGERDSFKEMYQNVHNDHSLMKNQLDILVKKNSESTKQLALYRKMNERLEAEVRKMMKSVDDNKSNLQGMYSDLLSEKEVQLLSCQEDLKHKGAELRDVRALAQMILDQRSDLEVFFLDALERVKIEVKKQRLEYKDNAKLPLIKKNIKSTQFSLVTEDPYTSRMKKLEEEKVDIRELTWEEKEKVLRYLFIRMNKGTAPAHWRQAQDYEEEDVEADTPDQYRRDDDNNEDNLNDDQML